MNKTKHAKFVIKELIMLTIVRSTILNVTGKVVKQFLKMHNLCTGLVIELKVADNHTAPFLSDSGNGGLLVLCLRRNLSEP